MRLPLNISIESIVISHRVVHTVLFLCLIVFSAASYAQLNPPDNICANVADNGNVEVTWQEADAVPPGAKYDLFRSNNDGNPWLALGQVTSGDLLQWIDFTATPGVGPVSYYIVTTSQDNSQQSAPSDTVSTLFLDLTPAIGSLNSVAQLDWNAPKSSSSPGTFEVYRQIDGEATESLIATLPSTQLTYLDTLFGLCIEPEEDPVNIKYFVTYVEGFCQMSSQSSVDGFQDLLGPVPPQVETVLIDPITGHAVIYWYPGSEPDLDEYLVQSVIFQPGGNDQFLNLAFLSTDNLEFTYEQASFTAPTNMVVIAFDVCGNDNSFNEIYSTMFAQSDYKSCDQFASLRWNAYEGWEEGVEKYIIHVEDGINTYQIEVEPDQLEYELEIIPNLEYRVYIEAISNGVQRPSTSNSTFFITAYPEVPDFAYNSRVSTIEDNLLQVDLLVDVNAQGAVYELYRSEAGQSFQLVSSFAQPNNTILTYLDQDVDAANLVYEYKWLVFDGCGQELFETNLSRNIILRATADKQNLINSLQWNEYGDWEEGALEYQVQRKLGSEADFSILSTVEPGQPLEYEDDVEEFLEQEGQFCYKIVAVENENSFGFSSISESNTACATQEPLMWIPNTIVINGFNDVFKPVAGFIDFTTYEMEIFNKWGEKLFYSNSIEDGWDGTYKGNYVREDMYQYVIVYSDGSGQSFVDQGPIYVLIDKP